MGVDYDASFGIGIEVISIDDDGVYILDLLEDFMDEYGNDKYTYIEVGSSSYSGVENKTFIIFKDDFNDIVKNYNNLKIELLNNINSFNKFGIVGDIGLHGGLHIH